MGVLPAGVHLVLVNLLFRNELHGGWFGVCLVTEEEGSKGGEGTQKSFSSPRTCEDQRWLRVSGGTGEENRGGSQPASQILVIVTGVPSCWVFPGDGEQVMRSARLGCWHIFLPCNISLSTPSSSGRLPVRTESGSLGGTTAAPLPCFALTCPRDVQVVSRGWKSHVSGTVITVGDARLPATPRQREPTAAGQDEPCRFSPAVGAEGAGRPEFPAVWHSQE